MAGKALTHKKAAWSKFDQAAFCRPRTPREGRPPKERKRATPKQHTTAGRACQAPAGRNKRSGRVKAGPSAASAPMLRRLARRREALTRPVKWSLTAAGGTPVYNFQDCEPGREALQRRDCTPGVPPKRAVKNGTLWWGPQPPLRATRSPSFPAGRKGRGGWMGEPEGGPYPLPVMHSGAADSPSHRGRYAPNGGP